MILKEDKPGAPVEKILDKGIFALGRDLRSDWAIKDPMVSREHAIIKEDQDGFYIEDRGSRNGTFVNKEKILRKMLSDQDEIRIGSATFHFCEKEGHTDSEISASSVRSPSRLRPLRRRRLSEPGRLKFFPEKRPGASLSFLPSGFQSAGEKPMSS
ncbi:MAG: FHA domain-containing protein [Candidatus Manganitrophus sp.]|nr:FHA domain-containing protein [Candidatus Manganitrophus sp.]